MLMRLTSLSRLFSVMGSNLRVVWVVRLGAGWGGGESKCAGAAVWLEGDSICELEC